MPPGLFIGAAVDDEAAFELNAYTIGPLVGQWAFFVQRYDGRGGWVSVLADGGIAPLHAMVFGRTQDCDSVCSRLADADWFRIASAAGPK